MDKPWTLVQQFSELLDQRLRQPLVSQEPEGTQNPLLPTSPGTRLSCGRAISHGSGRVDTASASAEALLSSLTPWVRRRADPAAEEFEKARPQQARLGPGNSV